MLSSTRPKATAMPIRGHPTNNITSRPRLPSESTNCRKRSNSLAEHASNGYFRFFSPCIRQPARRGGWIEDFRIFTAKVLKYEAASGNDYLGVHHDGSLLTFLIGLNGLDKYEGGGTFMEALEGAVRYEAGHLCCHPGIVRHGGDKVTSGVRYVLAAWIDISGVIEYDRQLCEEADLTRMSGRLDQTIQYDLGGSANTGKPDKKTGQGRTVVSLQPGGW